MKRLMPITIVVVLVGLAVTMATATAQSSDAEKIVNRYVQFWNTGDLSRAGDIIATDVVRIGPSFEFNARGLEGLKAYIARTRKDYANLKVDIRTLDVDGNRVVMGWTFEGIYRNPEHPRSNNKAIKLTGTSLYEIADGRIVAERVSWDYLDGYAQIGVEPPANPVEHNVMVARELLTDIYEKGNLEVAYDIIARDHEFHVPNATTQKTGPQGVQERAMMFRKAFPDLRFTVDETVASGDVVAFHWTMTGTQQGEFMGVAPTNRTIAISGLSLSRLSDGKLTESWGVWDTGELFKQLGVDKK